MKTGKVASGFKRDPKTIKRITDDYAAFFTDDAKREEEGKRTQRFYHMEDLVVLNSVLIWEYEGLDKEQVRARLEKGQREQDLPASFRAIDGDNALTVYTELSNMRLQIKKYEDQIEFLEQQADAKAKQHTQELIALAREAQDWKTRYEILKEELSRKDGKND